MNQMGLCATWADYLEISDLYPVKKLRDEPNGT